MNLDEAIRKVPDFPKPGILFYDVTSIFTNPQAFGYCVDSMLELYKGESIDGVISVESRGFLLGACFAYQMKLPLVLARKRESFRARPSPRVTFLSTVLPLWRFMRRIWCRERGG